MKLIAITKEDFIEGEAMRIMKLLESDFWRVHIRKPHSRKEEIERLLDEITPDYYPRLSLHDHHELALQRGIGGIHLNSRNPKAPDKWDGIKSVSCHSLEELGMYKDCDYKFLSPIFDSLSKKGYKSNFELSEFRPELLACQNVVALGGVTFDKLPLLEACGFYGGAMLTEAWQK